MSDMITLGGRRFDLRPLKLGQLRHVLDALDGMAGKSGGGLIEAAAHIVAAGLAPAHPDLTADSVLDLEATVDELNAAVAAVLRIAGLRPMDDPPGQDKPGQDKPGQNKPGEERPVASPAPGSESSSAPSTAPSPPAAAIPIR